MISLPTTYGPLELFPWVWKVYRVTRRSLVALDDVKVYLKQESVLVVTVFSLSSPAFSSVIMWPLLSSTTDVF